MIEIDIEVLQLTFNKLIALYQAEHGRTVRLANQFYWDISPPEKYQIEERITTEEIGDVKDYWHEVVCAQSKTNSTLSHDLRHLAKLIEALSDVL